MSRPEGDLKRRNDRIVLACAVFVGVMVGLSYAAVPLYRMFCQATGYGGATKVAKQAPGAVEDAVFTIRFDTNVANGLPWSFRPDVAAMTVKAGAQSLAFFKATNLSDQATVGAATYNVTPEGAGAYFNKIQCFCFDQQPLAGRQTADMPVSFFVDPAILNDPDLRGVRTITLSYTFFPASKVSALDKSGGSTNTRLN